MDDCHFLAWPQAKKFLKRRPLLRYITICKRRWNLTSDSCRAHLLKESFSHISHTFLMALRKRPGICLCGLSWSPNHCSLSLSLSLRSSIPDVPSRNSSPEKECEFWICFLMDCFARVLHCVPYNFPPFNLQRLILNYLQEKPSHSEPAPTSPPWRMNGQ
jgi:hypothetical protein